MMILPLLFFLGVAQSRNTQQSTNQIVLAGTPFENSASTFWLEQIKHEGLSPFYDNGLDWKVFRNVKDYGAQGDGVNDDTWAIQQAINDGDREDHPGGTTGTPALVYLPSGTYKISSAIQVLINTVIVGNPLAKPVIKPTDSLDGSTAINATDGSTQGTNNFYMAIRNIEIDTTGMTASMSVNALNWGVSQGTSLSNVDFTMPFGDTAHVGIVMQRGDGLSNTMIGDLKFTGGNIGIQMQGEQMLIKNVNFFGCRIAIQNVNSPFLVVLQGMHFDTCGTGIDNTTPAGGLYVIDSTNHNSGPAINTAATTNGQGSVLVDNLKVQGGENLSVVMGSTNISGSIDTWAHGNIFIDNSDDSTKNHFQWSQTMKKTNRPTSLLQPDGTFYLKKMPQYENVNASQVASVKSFGAKGDGRTDDTKAITAALSANANSKVTYFPHGVYLVSSTITVPPGSRLVGEVWSVISGSGGFFGDASNPKPIIQIGQPGSTGTAELTDLLITINDILPGAIGMEVNMAGKPGDVSIHNTHFRIGGATDSNVNNACGTSPPQCMAGFMLLHATQNSSAYFEDVWGWTADHALEGGTEGPGSSTYISTGRGFLIESQKATWMMGVAPEHQTLYGVNINNAQNVYIAMVEIETPYWQPNPPTSPNVLAPHPWNPNLSFGDPTFDNCAGSSDPNCYKAWGLRISGGSGVLIYGMATWTFFDNFDGNWPPSLTPCEAAGECQENAFSIAGTPLQSYLFGISTKTVKNMVVQEQGSGGQRVLAKQSENPGGWGGHLVAYLGFS
jgi:glucan 1,3-beta-glucosidase